MDANNNQTISNLSSTSTYIIATIISFILLIIINVIVYSKSFKMNVNEENSKIISIIFFIIAVCSLIAIMIFIPFQTIKLVFTSIKASLGSIKGFQRVMMVFIFIFLLIMMFFVMPKDTMNSYAYIFLPIIIPIGLFLIYRTFTSKLKSDPGILQKNNDFVDLARINYSLLFFAIIIFMSILYVNNPGGFIQKYVGIGIIYSLSLLALTVLYMVNVSNPKDQNPNSNPATLQDDRPFLQKYGALAISIILLIFSLTFLVPVLTNEKIMYGNTIKSAGIVIFSIIFLIFMTISFVKAICFLWKPSNITPGELAKIIEKDKEYNGYTNYLFFILIGFVALATILYWILVLYQHALATTNVGSIIIYTIAILLILVLVYKLVVTSSVYKGSPLFQMVFNTVFYIPCLIVSLYDNIMKTIPKNNTTNSVGNSITSGISSIKNMIAAPTPPIYYVVLVISTLLFVVYFIGPSFLKNLSQQGGRVLVNRPVELEKANYLGTYSQLNDSVDDNNYRYALSFWFYIDSASPGTRSSYERFTNILDYGGKPKVTYNAALNTLRVTMYVGPGGNENDNTNTYSPDLPRKKLDTSGTLIIYEIEKVKLQKWNNVILNYSGGTLDIFYDGELVKSVNGVIPYFTNPMSQPVTEEPSIINYDSLIIGQDDGLYGQICNVNYFKTALNIYQINYLYKSVKDYSPPALAYDNKIIPLDVNLGLGQGNILGESTIMEDLPPPSEDTTEQGNNQTSDEMATSSTRQNPDFFSLRWYFNANRDFL